MFRSSPARGGFPGGAVLLLSGFLAVMAYGVWYYLADRQKSLLDLVPEVPSQLRAILGKEVPTDVATVPPMVKPQSATPAAQDGTAGTAPAQGSAAPAGGTGPCRPSSRGWRPARRRRRQPTAAGATPSTIASQHATLPAPMASAAAPADAAVPGRERAGRAGRSGRPCPGSSTPSWPPVSRRQPDGQPAPPPAARSSWPIRVPG